MRTRYFFIVLVILGTFFSCTKSEQKPVSETIQKTENSTEVIAAKEPEIPLLHEDRWIDSAEGLNMRDQPDVSGALVTTVPAYAKVLLLRETGKELTIQDATGKWSEIEWEGQTGWVFGAYLRRPPEIEEGVLYAASSRDGRRNVGSKSTKREFVLLPEQRVRYTEDNYYYDGRDTVTYHGTYSWRGYELTMQFRDGIVITNSEGGSPEIRSADAATVTMIYAEHVTTTLMLQPDWEEITRDGGFELGTEGSHFVKEDEEWYYYRGWFVPMETFPVGSTGPAGGVVFYDKGSYTDGWRYLEVDRSVFWTTWGPAGIMIDALSTEIGAGKTNTERIASKLAAASPAAQNCIMSVEGGRDDWFLPSADEAKAMFEHSEVVRMAGLFFRGGPSVVWTSSENDTDTAWVVGGSGHASALRKDEYADVRAVRRF